MNDPGVKMNQPSASVASEINSKVDDYLSGTKHTGALISIVTTRGINLALVKKKNDRFIVETWIGKTWGGPVDGGIKGIVYF